MKLNKEQLKRLRQAVKTWNKKKVPVDEETFYEILEMHGVHIEREEDGKDLPPLRQSTEVDK